MEKQYIALAYYRFVAIEKPHLEVQRHKEFLSQFDASGRIYISEEGINGQMSALVEDVERYTQWLKSDPRFAATVFKPHLTKENIFPRMTVKYRQQLVALDERADVHEGGEHVSAAEWKKMLESGEYLLLDVRNDYEWEIGHFEGAVLPPLKTFREFPAYADQLKTEVDPATTKVMMYCTGGIRCELYSALLKKRGFEKVYQLDGGVIGYGLEEGSAYWKGKLFVFDERMAVSIDGEEVVPIATCYYCQTPCDTHYNCAHMDCNALFICCPSCYPLHKGCCTPACLAAPRIRPLEPERGNKPFRRKHLIECAATSPEVLLESTLSQPSTPV